MKYFFTVFYAYNKYNNVCSHDTIVLYTLMYICLQLCAAIVSRLLPFMVDITHIYCFRYISIVIALLGMYYICPGPVFQCEFNCDVYFVIGLTCFGNFENWQICICILHSQLYLYVYVF